jgi:hypothetical protein
MGAGPRSESIRKPEDRNGASAGPACEAKMIRLRGKKNGFFPKDLQEKANLQALKFGVRK